MSPYLDKAAASGRSQVAAIGVAQEAQRVFLARQRDTGPSKPPQFSFGKKDRRVTVYGLPVADCTHGRGGASPGSTGSWLAATGPWRAEGGCRWCRPGIVRHRPSQGRHVGIWARDVVAHRHIAEPYSDGNPHDVAIGVP